MATIISLVALFFAMGGTAVAATGGNFILGKSNTATSVTSLQNTKGTALSLSATSTKPPLTVSNNVQVPNLNASELGGNAPNAYMFGTGQVSHANNTLAYGSTTGVGLAGAGASFGFFCYSNGTSQFTITADNNSQVWWLNKDGEGYAALNTGQAVDLTPASANPYTVVVQVSWGPNVASWDLSMDVNTNAQTCSYAAQSVSDG